jgi:transcriptional regulator of arginine metabolism
MVLDINDNDLLVVIKTPPAAAATVAAAIDASRLPENLGTIAGDDTIFIAPSRGRTTRALSRKLKVLFGKEESP